MAPIADRRLGIKILPIGENTWVSLAYALTVPEDGALETAVLPLPDADDETGLVRFRVRITAAETSEVVWETAVSTATTTWQDTHIPLTAYANRPVILRLEISGSAPGAWANPRLVTDN
ncbi:MAG: hypothetical protein R3E31_28480 [Chloroflexota bacterium]